MQMYRTKIESPDILSSR